MTHAPAIVLRRAPTWRSIAGGGTTIGKEQGIRDRGWDWIWRPTSLWRGDGRAQEEVGTCTMACNRSYFPSDLCTRNPIPELLISQSQVVPVSRREKDFMSALSTHLTSYLRCCLTWTQGTHQGLDLYSHACLLEYLCLMSLCLLPVFIRFG
jgi:hypothetical protein